MQSIQKLKNYVAWYTSSGVQATGMNSTIFIPLYQSCNLALNQFSEQNNLIGQLRTNWQAVQNGNPAAQSASLIAILKNMIVLANELISTSSLVKSQSESLETQVNGQIQQLQNSIQTEQNQYNQAQVNYNNAVNAYNNAQSQMSGGSGFLTGFLTVVTFGIDNRIKQVEDQASNAKAAAQNSMQQSQQALSLINSQQVALNACLGTIGQLDDVINSATQIQNMINSAYADCSKAASDASAAASSSSQTVEQIFMKLADPAIQSLIGLGAEMNSALSS
jgi:hypothetical protein